MGAAAYAIRSLRAATGILLLWLFAAPVADAAPPARHPSVGAVCDAQTLTLRKLRRQPRSFGGPLKRLARRALMPLSETGSRMLHGSRAHLDDDEAAIQNDAPAASIDDDEQPVPALRPLGVLHSTLSQHPSSRAFSPRSPRGPPSYM
jgi:hypothetical protein